MNMTRNAIFASCALLASGIASSREDDTAVFENYAPASSSTAQTFSCAGSATNDVSAKYVTQVKAPGERDAKLIALEIRGVKATASELAEINTAVGQDNITGASVGCSSGGIRFSLQTYSASRVPDGGDLADGYAYVYVYLHTGSKQLSRQ